MKPDEAIAAAARRAEAAKAQGAYADALQGFAVEPAEHVTPDDLFTWAVVEPDERDLVSTRPYGRPITALKRWLVRFLHQYHVQVLSAQNRHNVSLTAYTVALEKRVAELEARVAELESERPPAA
jgi:hypothetical protein